MRGFFDTKEGCFFGIEVESVGQFFGNTDKEIVGMIMREVGYFGWIVKAIDDDGKARLYHGDSTSAF